jgi:hypothetical protein
MALEDAKNPLKGVSGPGKYAKRTDRIPANSYGDQTELGQIASGAPIAQTPDTKGMPMGQMQTAAAQGPVTPLFAPTERPDVPITNGIDMGPGAGSDALAMNQIQQDDKDIVAKYLPSLTAMASQQDTPKSFRSFVSFLQGSL